jgi:hypothetical protein
MRVCLVVVSIESRKKGRGGDILWSNSILISPSSPSPTTPVLFLAFPFLPRGLLPSANPIISLNGSNSSLL